MNSILSRFKAIFQARASTIVGQMEDPRASLDYSLTRLEENRRHISRSLVDVAAAKERLKRQWDQMTAAAARYEEQARASVEAGRDDLARAALQRKEEVEDRRSELESSVANLERQVANLKQSQTDLDRKIVLFRSKKEELKSIYDSSQAQLRVREALTGISEDLADVGNTIQRAEARIQEMQSRAEAIDTLISEGVLADVLEPETDDIDRELARIGRRHAVEEELERLKAEVTHG